LDWIVLHYTYFLTKGLSGSTPAEVLFAWPPAASDAVAPLLLRRVVKCPVREMR